MQKNEKYWQEIFDSVDLDFLPASYLKSITVEFEDNTIWEIDLNGKDKKNLPVDEILEDFFRTYEDTITSVDFNVDFVKVKRDITKKTQKFLKNK
jgi:hypothetical protein